MTLKPADADFMLRTLTLSAALQRRVEDFRKLGLPISDDDKNELRDLVSDQLIIKGFDEHYELTPIGHRLGELIGALFVDKGAA